ncbi:MAG: hypothetical protein U0U67_10700 [Chitinophagales bacterium]
MEANSGITSEQYIDSLCFEYIETYSLLRGNDYQNKIDLMEIEYKKLEQTNTLNQSDSKRFSELDQLLNYTQYLIDLNGEFHFSSIKTNTFYKGDKEIETLKTILKIKAINIVDWMCAPEFRDAIVFYDSNHKIVSCLNICLSCDVLEADKTNIQADQETFLQLRKFLTEYGHDIESE